MLVSYLRVFFKCLIGLFCLWHMAAIGIYSLQNVDSQPVLKWLEQKQYIFRSYVLMTSQWQRWNLFSPDPLRRVIVMTVETQTDGIWRNVRTIDYDHLSYFRRASELKIIRRIEEDNQEKLKEVYLQDICRTEKIPFGTPIRLLKKAQVVPRHDAPQSIAYWRQWQPEWQETMEQETTCKHQLQPTYPPSDL